MPRKEPLFTFRLTGVLLSLLGLKGKDSADLLVSMGLPLDAKDGECTVPLSRVRSLVDEAARRKRDPILGLSLSKAVPEGTYDAAELLVRTAPTVGKGLAALAKHAALVNPIGQFRYDETKEQAELHYLVPGQADGLGMHMNEYTIAYILRGLGLVAERELPISSVWFAHDRSTKRELVSTFFGCPVRFRAATSGFALSLEAARRATQIGRPARLRVPRAPSREKPSRGRCRPILRLRRAGHRNRRRLCARRSPDHCEVSSGHRTNGAAAPARGRHPVSRRPRSSAASVRRRARQEARTRGARRGALGFADVSTYRRAKKRWQS